MEFTWHEMPMHCLYLRWWAVTLLDGSTFMGNYPTWYINVAALVGMTRVVLPLLMLVLDYYTDVWSSSNGLALDDETNASTSCWLGRTRRRRCIQLYHFYQSTIRRFIKLSWVFHLDDSSEDCRFGKWCVLPFILKLLGDLCATLAPWNSIQTHQDWCYEVILGAKWSSNSDIWSIEAPVNNLTVCILEVCIYRHLQGCLVLFDDQQAT